MITEHLVAGYDLATTRGLLDEFGCEAEVATMGKPAPIEAGKRQMVERTNSWHDHGFKKLAICTGALAPATRSSPWPTRSSPSGA